MSESCSMLDPLYHPWSSLEWTFKQSCEVFFIFLSVKLCKVTLNNTHYKIYLVCDLTVLRNTTRSCQILRWRHSGARSEARSSAFCKPYLEIMKLSQPNYSKNNPKPSLKTL